MKCIFCNIDKSKIENTIIDETNYFYIMPSIGALVDGYLLIVSKRHINSMAELTLYEMEEYTHIIEKYRQIFKKVYGKYPIIFEHGSPILDNKKANSVIHGHTHIVNHQYIDEHTIIQNQNFQKIEAFSEICCNKNYIMYKNPLGDLYVSYSFEGTSQLMRKLIAVDLGYEQKYDWKKELFLDNIKSTIKKMKNIKK